MSPRPFQRNPPAVPRTVEAPQNFILSGKKAMICSNDITRYHTIELSVACRFNCPLTAPHSAGPWTSWNVVLSGPDQQLQNDACRITSQRDSRPGSQTSLIVSCAYHYNILYSRTSKRSANGRASFLWIWESYGFFRSTLSTSLVRHHYKQYRYAVT
jgi:hypothetical protein